MPRSETLAVDSQGRRVEVYSGTARFFHWLTVLLIAIQFPVGLYMVYRGPGQNIWDATTNNLYSGHKLAGVIILALVLVRLLYRLTAGAPADEPTLTGWQKVVSALNHWGIYLLLIAVPIFGYLAVCYFPALNIFGAFSLPALVAPDKEMYKQVIAVHYYTAMALAALIVLHIAAALYHHAIRGDNVLVRMMPGLLKKR